MEENGLELKEVKEAPTEFRELSCDLTRVELDDYRDLLAANTQKANELEAEKSRISADYSARIKELSASLNVLARKISTRKEYRQVECRWSFDWSLGMKYLTRQDTLDVVERRKATDFDRQTYMKLDPKEKTEGTTPTETNA